MTQTRVTIDEFVAGLEALPQADFVNACTDYLQRVQLVSESVAPYAHFIPNGYTRNLVFKNELFEILALCWEPGHASSIHNHRDQSCWMVMAQGQLENQNYRVLDRDEEAKTCRLEESLRFPITAESPAAVDDDEPVHQIRNLKEYGGRAISIHIYSRPFDTCEVYCPDKGIYGDIQLYYWSEYGKLVREQVQEPCQDS